MSIRRTVGAAGFLTNVPENFTPTQSHRSIQSSGLSVRNYEYDDYERSVAANRCSENGEELGKGRSTRRTDDDNDNEGNIID